MVYFKCLLEAAEEYREKKESKVWMMARVLP